ncbi:MAG: hypothetical protein HC905_29350 [Bacteroidales bacterium]|nr:hypothetical protein [Bacteroidales bacterium]
MGNPAKNINPEITITSKTTKEKINETYTPELIIGLCYPIGTKVNEVKESITNNLHEIGYIVIPIKLSEFINKYEPDTFKETIESGRTEAFTLLNNKIKGGDKLRSKYNNSILAELAIYTIHLNRTGTNKYLDKLIPDTEYKGKKVCYLIDSLKNLDELHLLRSIYKDIFYLFSIFTPVEERIKYLASKEKGLSEPEATEIIDKDDHENITSGQNVRETFVDADFFIRISNNIKKDQEEEFKKEIDEKVIRIINLIFESAIVTPSPHESAMYQAKSAAANSACPSRQVGASITDKLGNVLSIGWNDVPKCGGNLYVDNENGKDFRCYEKGGCHNDQKKDELTKNIVDLIFDNEDIFDILNKKNKIKISEIEKMKN